MKNITSINTERFELKPKEDYDVFIWLGKNFMQLAATTQDQNKVEAIKTYAKPDGNITKAEAENIFKEKIVQGAKNCFVGLESKKFTYVPSAIFDDKNITDYLSYLYNIEPIESVRHQQIKPIKAHAVYSLKKGTADLLNQRLRSVTTCHAPSALLVAYQQLLPPNKQYNSFVRLHQDEILISVFDKKQLRIHKSYDIESLDDAVYYYFFVLQQLNIESKKTTLNILGNHTEIEQFHALCKPNVEIVKFANRLPTLQYNEAVFSHPTHHFFNLFSLMLCA